MAASRRRRASQPRAAGRAQRRQVSVLICDLARSVDLAARIDPEDMRDVVHAYLNAFAARIEAAGGFIARYMGDGVMAYFGYPLAREGDPARAVRAAMAITAAAQELTPPHGHRLAVRCGVATGLTVIGDLVGEGIAAERGAFGAAPNLAARLQAAANAGETVICPATAKMTEGLFALDPTGALDLKGFPEPQAAFRVRGTLDSPGLLAERFTPLATPFAGRAQEMAALAAAWRRAAGGRTTLVALSGEAGIGKSRLIREFQRSLRDVSHFWFEASADSSLTDEAYGVARRLILAPSGTDRMSERRLREMLATAGLKPEASLPLIAPLIGLSAATGTAPQAPPAADRRRTLNDLLLKWLIARTSVRPAVVVIEDLQWADPSTLDVLRAVATAQPRAPLLVVLSVRDPEDTALNLRGPLRRVHLERLDDAAIGGIVRRLAGDLTPDRIAALVRRSDGNPLFAEALSQQSASGAGDGVVPDTLIGLLTARLDAAGAAAHVARIASILGRSFKPAFLARLAGRPARAIEAALSVLADTGIVVRSGETAQFRHALIHEAAYLSLLKEDRRSLHRRAATLLLRAAPRDAGVARHWRAAGESRRAVDAFRVAARAHVADHAYGEAALAYRAALETLGEVSSTTARDIEELELCSALTAALQIAEGYSASSSVASATRARVLAERIGDGARLLKQITPEWAAASSAGDYVMAREFAARAIALAEAAGAADMLGSAHMMLMTAVYRAGALAEGEAVFRAGARHFRAPAFLRQPGALPQTFGNAAVNAWLLGQDRAARQRNARVVAHGAKTDAPYLRAFAHYMASMQHVLMDEAAEAEAFGRDAMTISDREGFPQFAATARIVLGRALAMQGKRREGIALLRAGIDRMAINRSRNGLTMYLTWLAQSEAEAGNVRAARTAAETALTLNPGERFFRAETLRIRALVSPPDQARNDLLEAIGMAAAMRAAWQEARARADLAAMAAGRTVRRKA
ncbi:MAG: AAA family ATPase [Micropepsaceae bacterium]